ncbi:hypothetical protein [Cohnella hashimotonis]|uniref:Uncharacterized protein n=1 Tax=Cohnella hashimotonis TaxID=2826895 RepID=A0ABT6TNP9_9BACL|nr:hypothetical protein [Cohnella hashimotonis]MDI4648483.1 hypothetical protein [Cohnella hashimotonis]
MKSKSVIAKLAVAAMAVTALASPVAAFAATGPALSKQYAISQASQTGVPAQFASAGEAKAISSSAILQLPDPGEIAAKYAPDAVPEWKETLAAYNKLVQGKDTLSLSATALPAATASSLDGATKAAHPVTVVSARQGTLTAPAGTVSLQAVKTVAGADLQAVALSAPRAEGIIVSTTAVASFSAGSGILQGRIALGEAVETGDAEKIKQALDKLLAQYKAVITELRQAK